MAKQNKITKSARDEECTLQIFPYCNQDPATTVLAHLPCEDKGMAKKSPDWWSAYACSTCHGIIDGHIKTDLSQEEINKCMMRGKYRTMKRMIEKGLIKID